jgi:acetyl-CoA acyltransferase
MPTAVIVDCVRTPVGRSHAKRGAYRDVRSDELVLQLLRALITRTGIDPNEIEDVILGTTRQIDEQSVNVARMVVLAGGLPFHIGGVTVNRLCGSSLQAVNQAANSIVAGCEEVLVVGGLEHMHHVPIEEDFKVHPNVFSRMPKAALLMGQTAEHLAVTRHISRDEQDRFALRSHQRAIAAYERGEFKRELVPITTPGREPGQTVVVDRDQCVRPEICLTQLGLLQPAFNPVDGTVTAGNCSPLNDGAALMLMMSDTKAKELGLRPLVRFVTSAVTGVDPMLMGMGPVPATEKALKRAKMTLRNVDLIELNEAFAAQVLACLQDFPIDPDRLNVRGGAIALGHPLGASGARMLTTLINTLVDRDLNVGLATLCIGIGQGITTIIERV